MPTYRRPTAKNFATKFAFWDWLFGTAYFPDRRTRKAEQFGLDYDGFPEPFPQAYFLQHLWSVRPRRGREAVEG